LEAATVRPGEEGTAAPRRGLRRDVGRIGLLFTSVGSVIGSGWLLGALNATTIAGPAAILSWVIGAAAVMLLALVIAELGSMRPVGGGNARYPHFAFGSLIGFGMGWIYWLGSVTLAPVETEAALQYATKYVNDWIGINLVHSSGGTDVLTAWGYLAAAILMLLFTILNLYGVSRLTRVNTAIVWWKIAIPLITIVAIAVTQFKGSNFSAGDGFAPNGFHGILAAVATGGVIFSFGVGMIVFLPFPGWQKLVSFITSATVIIYSGQCVSVAALRKQLPDVERPFRMPALSVIAPVAFVIANEIVLFAGWTTNWKLLAAVALGFVLLGVSNLTRPREERASLEWRPGIWLIPWLAILGLISYLSSFEGGQDTLKFGVDMLATAVLAGIVYVVAMRVRLSPQAARANFDETEDEVESLETPV
jgi:amino acid transporter